MNHKRNAPSFPAKLYFAARIKVKNRLDPFESGLRLNSRAPNVIIVSRGKGLALSLAARGLHQVQYRCCFVDVDEGKHKEEWNAER